MQAFHSAPHEAAVVDPPGDAVLAWTQVGAAWSGAAGDGADAWFDLGLALSTGGRGMPCDLVEAHKWFNLAARSGHAEGARWRTELAREMTAGEIADAQRRAREWLRRAG